MSYQTQEELATHTIVKYERLGWGNIQPNLMYQWP